MTLHLVDNRLDKVASPVFGAIAGADPHLDTALPALPDWMGRAELIDYHPGERAMLRWHDGNMMQYVQVVEPRRAAGLARHWLQLGRRDHSSSLRDLPRLVSFDHLQGWLSFAMAPGQGRRQQRPSGRKTGAGPTRRRTPVRPTPGLR